MPSLSHVAHYGKGICMGGPDVVCEEQDRKRVYDENVYAGCEESSTWPFIQRRPRQAFTANVLAA